MNPEQEGSSKDQVHALHAGDLSLVPRLKVQHQVRRIRKKQKRENILLLFLHLTTSP